MGCGRDRQPLATWSCISAEIQPCVTVCVCFLLLCVSVQQWCRWLRCTRTGEKLPHQHLRFSDQLAQTFDIFFLNNSFFPSPICIFFICLSLIRAFPLPPRLSAAPVMSHLQDNWIKSIQSGSLWMVRQ